MIKNIVSEVTQRKSSEVSGSVQKCLKSMPTLYGTIGTGQGISGADHVCHREERVDPVG